MASGKAETSCKESIHLIHSLFLLFYRLIQFNPVRSNYFGQDFLVLAAPYDGAFTPANIVWLTNSKVDGDWNHIPTQRLIRAYIPRLLISSGINFAWRVLDNHGEALLTSSIRLGIWLSADNLRLICGRLEVELPVKPHGSGDGGGVVKIDLAVALVKHLFPLATADEQQRMAAAITWRNPENLGESERDILKYVSELDSENREAPEFTRIAKLASQKLKEKEDNEMTEKVREQLQRERKEKEEKSLLEEDRKAKAASMTEESALGDKGKSIDTSAASSGHHGRKASETPPSLREFLSFDMVQAKISINRDSGNYGYRAFYPGGGF